MAGESRGRVRVSWVAAGTAGPTWVVVLSLLAIPVAAQDGRRAGEGRLGRLGIVGDGVADESAAIQKAIDDGIGSLSFPRGTYRLTKTVVVNLDKTGFTSISGDGTARFVMAGPGPAFRFVGTLSGNASPAQIKPDVWDRQRAPQISGIEILGEHEESDGIEANGIMQLTVSRVVVRKTRHAVHFTNRNRNVIVDACHLYDNRGCGVFYENVSLHQSNIVGCHISYNRGGGVVARGGDVRNIHIGTCDIEGNHSSDDPPSANVEIDSTDGSGGIAEVAITGCTLQHNPFPGSANIRINGQSLGAKREGYITITGNVLSDVETSIELKNVRGATITGNTLWSARDRDIHLENCVGIVMTGNSFDRNPRVGGDESKSKGGVSMNECVECTLTGSHISGIHGHLAGIQAENCLRLNIADCIVTNCDGAGILLKDASSSRVAGCIVRDARPDPEGDAVAISVSGGIGNRVSGNITENPNLIDPRSAKVD